MYVAHARRHTCPFKHTQKDLRHLYSELSPLSRISSHAHECRIFPSKTADCVHAHSQPSSCTLSYKRMRTLMPAHASK